MYRKYAVQYTDSDSHTAILVSKYLLLNKPTIHIQLNAKRFFKMRNIHTHSVPRRRSPLQYYSHITVHDSFIMENRNI